MLATPARTRPTGQRKALPSHEQVAHDLAMRKAARERLTPFCQYVWPNYVTNPYRELMCSALEKLERREIMRLMIFLPPQHGKLIADDTPVLTANGWKTHGELEVGDKVFNPSGEATRVVAVNQLIANADVRVEFTNGEVIYCHPDHEWTVYDRPNRAYRTYETSYFMRQTKFGNPVHVYHGGRSVFQLPPVDPLQFAHAELPLDPYVLGAWLGDGSTTKPTLTHAADEAEVVAAFVGASYPISYNAVHKDTGVHSTGFSNRVLPGRNLWADLKTAGVANYKHIPTAYKMASVPQRLELLAGLIDTDGYVYPRNGRVVIVTCNRLLAFDIKEVIQSFGWHGCISIAAPHTSSSGITGRQDTYYVSFTPTIHIPTKLRRKQTTHLQTKRRIGIKSVTSDPQGYTGRCIQVEAEDGLYLVGKSLIPTHNSTIAMQFYPTWYMGRNPEHAQIMCSYNTSLARRNSSEARNKILEPRYQNVFGTSSPFSEPVVLSGKSRSKEEWGLEFHRGRMKAAGVGAGITGFGAHQAGVDDPVRSQREGDSELSKEEQWEWYWSSLYTRLSPDGVIYFTMTRWAVDDICGQLLAHQAEGGDLWHVLRVPFLAETKAQTREWMDRNNITPDRYLVSKQSLKRYSEEADEEEDEYEGEDD